MNNVQNSLSDSQIQISSKQKTQTFDGLDVSVEQFTSIKSQISRMGNYQQNNTTTIAKMQTVNTSLGQIGQLASSLKSLIQTQISGSSNNASFTQQLRSQLDSLSSVLNTSYGGNYVFSGSDIGTPPIKIPVPHSVQSGVPDQIYYQGSDQDPVVRISESQTITSGIRANSAEFQKLFAGISQALQSPTDTKSLQNAEDLIDQGLQGIVALQSKVNSTILNVQQTNSQMQTTQTYFQGFIDDNINADVVGLTAKVSQDTVTLQASFSTFARISGLSLVNYLK